LEVATVPRLHPPIGQVAQVVRVAVVREMSPLLGRVEQEHQGKVATEVRVMVEDIPVAVAVEVLHRQTARPLVALVLQQGQDSVVGLVGLVVQLQ